MRKTVLWLASAAVLLAACGGSTTVSTAFEEISTDTVSTTPAAPAGETDGDTEATPPEDTTADESEVNRVTDFEGPVAGDFTIELARSGTFTLSEESRPVYLIFWAEW